MMRQGGPPKSVDRLRAEAHRKGICLRPLFEALCDLADARGLRVHLSGSELRLMRPVSRSTTGGVGAPAKLELVAGRTLYAGLDEAAGELIAGLGT